MIYLESEKSNQLFVSSYHDFQAYYDACLLNWNTSCIFCSACEGKNRMTKNGFYKRRVMTACGIESVRIQRMRCPCCGHSEALFPVDIVPYSPIMAEEHVAIIEFYLESSHVESFFNRISVTTEKCEEALSLLSVPDFTTIAKLAKRFDIVWTEFLTQILPLFNSLYSLAEFCIHEKKCHFQQIRGIARYIHTGALAADAHPG